MFKSRSDETNVTHRQTDVKKARESTRAAFFSSDVRASALVLAVDAVFLSSESAAAAVGRSKTLKASLCSPALL